MTEVCLLNYKYRHDLVDEINKRLCEIVKWYVHGSGVRVDSEGNFYCMMYRDSRMG